MKATLLSTILAIVINCQAQKYETGFRVSIPEQANKGIFDRNPDLHHIQIRYRNNEAATLSIYHHDGKGEKLIETFYTHFEGDCYVLNKRYPDLIIPQAPKLDVWLLNDMPNLQDSISRKFVSTTLKRDTLIHNFNYSILQKDTYDFSRSEWNEPIVTTYKLKDSTTQSDTAYFLHPVLKGNILGYGKKLTNFYRAWKPIAVVDSVLLITATVEKNGTLSDIQLKKGDSSAFSKRVLEFIAQESNSWWPLKVDSVSKVRSKTRIFVRLNRDDTVTFSTL